MTSRPVYVRFDAPPPDHRHWGPLDWTILGIGVAAALIIIAVVVGSATVAPERIAPVDPPTVTTAVGRAPVTLPTPAPLERVNVRP